MFGFDDFLGAAFGWSKGGDHINLESGQRIDTEDYEDFYDCRGQYIRDFYNKMWHSYKAELVLQNGNFALKKSHKLNNLQQAINKRNNEIRELENRLRKISQISL